jgi:hypothetical protein
VQRAARTGHGRLERVEVDRYHIDQADRMLRQCAQVLRRIAPSQDAGVYGRVQRLHPPIQDFGKSGDLRDLGHGDATLEQGAGRAAGRKNREAQPHQRACKLDRAGLVGHADQGVAKRHRGSISADAPRVAHSRPACA